MHEPVPRHQDLRILSPSELCSDTMGFSPLKHHILRVTTTVVIAGAGSLELRGERGAGQLVQRLCDGEGGVVDRPLPEADFVFYADHHHWHLVDFA